MKRLQLLLVLALLAGCTARDDTDSPTERSGVILITDHGTGCQYLMAPGTWGGGSGITPRMGRDGRQICQERAK